MKKLKTFEGYFFQMDFDLRSNKPMDVETPEEDRISIGRKVLVEMATSMFREIGEADGQTRSRIEYVLDNTVVGTIHTHTGDILEVLCALAANVPGIKFSEDDQSCYVKGEDDASEGLFTYDPKNKIRGWYRRNCGVFTQMERDLQDARRHMKHGGGNSAPDWGRNADGTYDTWINPKVR